MTSTPVHPTRKRKLLETPEPDAMADAIAAAQRTVRQMEGADKVDELRAAFALAEADPVRALAQLDECLAGMCDADERERFARGEAERLLGVDPYATTHLNVREMARARYGNAVEQTPVDGYVRVGDKRVHVSVLRELADTEADERERLAEQERRSDSVPALTERILGSRPDVVQALVDYTRRLELYVETKTALCPPPLDALV